MRPSALRLSHLPQFLRRQKCFLRQCCCRLGGSTRPESPRVAAEQHAAGQGLALSLLRVPVMKIRHEHHLRNLGYCQRGADSKLPVSYSGV